MMEKQCPTIKMYQFFPVKDAADETVKDSKFESDLKVTKGKEGQEEHIESKISTDLALSFESQRENKKRKLINSAAESFKIRKSSRRRVYDQDHLPLLGVSTELKLYEDPWKIKKTMTQSDLGNLSRLLLATVLVIMYVFPVLRVDEVNNAESENGTKIRFWDLDIGSKEYELVLKRWPSSKSYVFIGNWNQYFVKRRELKKGDEIGLHWDPYHRRFNFSVLKRAM
ncbi:B3 domain-containing protein [Quillaja saponaria]|uniref:B3 domain-containing protein n=1 Tax=Quillaja saponaria TaxID=32244 RepID=A0AAD7P5X2_QUISA|nr:B3 domain-containing protein [Quillaja saponaria]